MLAAVAATVMLLCVIAYDVIFSPWPGQLTAERSLPPTVGVGDRAGGEYRLSASWPRALEIRLFDRLPAAVGRLGNGGEIARISPGEQAVIPFALIGRARGMHDLGPIAVQVRGPLGLVDRTHRFSLGDAITVAPSITGVRRYRLLSLQHRLRDAGVRSIRRRGEGTSFANLRDYSPGDDPRHIDWKATARRRKPITREFTVEQGQTVMIVIDAGRLMTQLAGPFPRFEYALSSALVLADVAAQSGDQVGLMLFDTEVRAFVPPTRGRAALESIRGALVPATATMAEPDYAAAFRTLAAKHRKRSLIVLFTDVIDTRASQSLIAHATRSAARHLPLVVALRNDHLLATANPAGRTTSTALYESAAAEELLLAREEALGRMRRAGVAVVDVSPQGMTTAVVNRYLEVKSRSAL
jgi:uncharacterized protein (DUF58 family)